MANSRGAHDVETRFRVVLFFVRETSEKCYDPMYKKLTAVRDNRFGHDRKTSRNAHRLNEEISLRRLLPFLVSLSPSYFLCRFIVCTVHRNHIYRNLSPEITRLVVSSPPCARSPRRTTEVERSCVFRLRLFSGLLH